MRGECIAEELPVSTAVDSTAPARLRLSVIIPVFANRPSSVELFRTAIQSLGSSEYSPYEVFVADDASPSPEREQIAAIAREAGARLVRIETNSGPAVARNAAAAAATGDVLVFLDADTAVHSDTLGRFADAFERDPSLDALSGAYDTRPAAPGTVSQFRNLLHCYVHRNAKREASAFWAGCGAVRRWRFHSIGGFDERFERPSIEDVEFGLRLRAGGAKLELDPRIEVTHGKQLSLASTVRTDLFDRAIPWTGLLREHPLPFDLNFRVSDRVSVAATGMAPLFALVAARHGGVWWGAAAAAPALVAILNFPLFRFLSNVQGAWFAIRSFPLLLLYFATCGVGLLAGFARVERKRDRYLWPTVAVIAAVLTAMQWLGGAWNAEFDGHPDEAAHFVSSLMIHDFLAAPPFHAQFEWAQQYYLHYPKVAIGQWPPGYHLLQAGWWLIWGPSRSGVMSLQWLIGLVTLTMLYRLARRSLPLAVTWGVVALMAITPVFQWSLSRCMADLTCLMWSVLLMDAIVRFWRRPGYGPAMLAILWLCAAIVTKGTALALVLAAPVALVGVPAATRLRWILASVPFVTLAASWYFLIGNVESMGGISLSPETWPGPLFGKALGWGFLLLALAGLRRDPLSIVAAAVVSGTLAMSVAVHAMHEIRHWIMAVPAVLILSGYAITRLPKAPALALLAVAVAMFPFQWYRQTAAGYGDLLKRLDRPARMLVSSEGHGEGAWTAAVALTETRPGSFVVRASKVLGESAWSGRRYRLLTPDSAAVHQRLDELAIDTVVLHEAWRQEPPQAHHGLLRNAVSSSSAWRPCGREGELEAYCRTGEPELPRKALRLRIRGWEFVEGIQN